MRIRSEKLLAAYKNQRKMTLWALVAVFLMFILSTLVSLVSLKLMSDENAKDSNTIISATIYEKIMDHMTKPIVSSLTISKDSFLHDVLANESEKSETQITNYLKGLQAGLDFESIFVVSTKTKKYYTFDGVKKIVDPENDPHDIWYSLFLEQNREYDLDVDNDQNNNNEWTIFINTRFEDKSGKLMAVCGVGFAISKIQKTIKELEDYYGVKINLVNTKGLVQVDSESINIENAILNDIADDIKNTEGFHYLSNSNDLGRTTRYIPKLGWFLVIQHNRPVKQENYIRVIELNIAVFLIISIILLVILYYLKEKTKVLSNTSYKDALTKANNRRAFEDDKQLFQAKKPEAFTCICADLNSLKRINDNYGHDKGDELIVGGYSLLEKLFSKLGYIYRTGGDEFVLFVEMAPEAVKLKVDELEKLQKAWSLQHNMTLSISIGFSSALTHPYITIDDHIKIADTMMYEQKKAFYSLKENDQRVNRS